MADIVSTAITNAAVNFSTTPQTKWTVTFLNNETRKGVLVPFSNGNYLLQGDQRPYYFSADKVVFLTISENQN